MTTSIVQPTAAPIAETKTQDRVDLRNYTLLIVVAIVFGVFQVLTDGLFLSQRNLGLLALQATIVGLASISAVMLIVTRNFDLSVGSAVALVGVVLASLTVKLGWNPWLAVLVAIAAGVVLGAWNAVWVAKVGVSSFIVTLAGMMIFRGISLIVTDGATVAPIPATLTDLAAGYLAPAPSIVLVAAALGAFTLFTVSSARRAQRFGLVSDWRRAIIRTIVPALLATAIAVYVSLGKGIPYLILVLAAMATIADVLMRRTRFGAQLYAVGGNPEAARLAGISLSRVVLLNFVIAGFFYGITGVALTARVSGAIGGTAGLFLELDAIAAAVIGGTSLAGGRGRVLGALLGATLMGALNNGMSLMNIATFYQQTARGSVLLLAVAIDQLSRRSMETTR
jgi:D-xylose transport system permease protein